MIRTEANRPLSRPTPQTPPDPTARQFEALRVIDEHRRQYAFSPTVRELADALNITVHPAHALIEGLFACELLEEVWPNEQRARNWRLSARGDELLRPFHVERQQK